MTISKKLINKPSWANNPSLEKPAHVQSAQNLHGTYNKLHFVPWLAMINLHATVLSLPGNKAPKPPWTIYIIFDIFYSTITGCII